MKRDELIDLLSLTEERDIKELFDRAYAVKLANVGNKVYFRGLIELSNICTKNCYYCGIRRDNKDVERFVMDEEEAVAAGLWAWKAGYGSVVLQAGERSDPDFCDLISRILRAWREKTNGELGVTLSLGEQDEEVYREWFSLGASRYLLRIETSNRELYASLHPGDHSFDRRLECLQRLKVLGYQVGTGVMSALPRQTARHLADDIMFFRDIDADMIGMGPYIPSTGTPLAEHAAFSAEDALRLGLKMIAVTRLELLDVNIAASTALQALHPLGREKGLQAGANVIMPNISDPKYKTRYRLYDGKPCLDENAEKCATCLEARIRSIGEEIAYNEPGTPRHFIKRTQENKK